MTKHKGIQMKNVLLTYSSFSYHVHLTEESSQNQTFITYKTKSQIKTTSEYFYFCINKTSLMLYQFMHPNDQVTVMRVQRDQAL